MSMKPLVGDKRHGPAAKGVYACGIAVWDVTASRLRFPGYSFMQRCWSCYSPLPVPLFRAGLLLMIQLR